MEYICHKFILNKDNKLDIRLDNPLELSGNEWYCGLKEFSLEPKWSLTEDFITVNFINGSTTVLKPKINQSYTNIEAVLNELFPNHDNEESQKRIKRQGALDRLAGMHDHVLQEMFSKRQKRDVVDTILGDDDEEETVIIVDEDENIAENKESKVSEEKDKKVTESKDTKMSESKEIEVKESKDKNGEEKKESKVSEEKKESKDKNVEEKKESQNKNIEEKKVSKEKDNKKSEPSGGPPKKKPKVETESYELTFKKEDPQGVKQTWIPKSGYFPEKIVNYAKIDPVQESSGVIEGIPIAEKLIHKPLPKIPAVLFKKDEEESQEKSNDNVSKLDINETIAIPSAPGRKPLPAIPKIANFDQEEDTESEEETSVKPEISKNSQKFDKQLAIPAGPGKRPLPAIPKIPQLENYAYMLAGLKSIKFTNALGRYSISFDPNYVLSLELSQGFAKAIGYDTNFLSLNGQTAMYEPGFEPLYSHVCVYVNGILRPLNKTHDAEIGIIPVHKFKTAYAAFSEPLYFKVEKTFVDTLSLEFKDFSGNPIVCDRANGHFVLQFVKQRK